MSYVIQPCPFVHSDWCRHCCFHPDRCSLHHAPHFLDVPTPERNQSTIRRRKVSSARSLFFTNAPPISASQNRMCRRILSESFSHRFITYRSGCQAARGGPYGCAEPV